MLVSAELAAVKRKLRVNMMDAVTLSAAVKKLQEANPTLQYDTDKFGLICVNGIDYRGEEYWEMKHPVKSVRPTIVKKLVNDKVWWTNFTMEFMKKTNAIMTLRKSVLPRKVQAMKKTSAMSKLRKSILLKKVQDWKKKIQKPRPNQASSRPRPYPNRPGRFLTNPRSK